MLLWLHIQREDILASLFFGGSLGELIKYVKATLAIDLPNYPSFLQQVIRNSSTNRLSMVIEHDLQILSLCIIRNSSVKKVRLLIYIESHTCRLELLFRRVLAHPKLSSNGLVARTISFISLMLLSSPPETAAMYCIMRLAASVLPAPDSPDMMTHWFSLYACIL